MDIEKILISMTLEEKALFCSGHDFWHTKGYPHLGIEPVMMCDGPHGLRKQKGEGDHLGINESIKAVCFPAASAMASSFDRDLLYQLGETLGEECQSENLAMLLGPGLNIKRSPLCGRNFEYFSEDPYLAGELGASYIQGVQSKGVAACVKHFAANNQETRRMSSNSVVDERTLHEIYLPAFEAAVRKGKTRSVMCSYNKVNGTYMAENKELLTEILREKWGFDGFVVTDWGAVKDQIKGLTAGLDLDMPGPGKQSDKIITAVNNGSLDEEVLNKAVKNLLRFVKSYQEQRNEQAVFDLEKDHDAAGKFAAECAVLLKNENNILPLEQTAKVAFIGEFAENPRYQGSGSSFINSSRVTSAIAASSDFDVIYAKGYHANEEITDEKLLAEAIEFAGMAEAAVVFAGLPNSYETEGVDREHLSLPDNQNDLILKITAVQPNTIVVLHCGAPVEMPWEDQVSAILHMHLGGQNVGTAEVALLYGEANPSGKLAETYPLKLADNPSYLNFPGDGSVTEYREGIYVGYRYYDKKQMSVLYPFGHGLSYTTFEYSDITVDKEKFRADDTLVVTCKVMNTGKRAGKEVVQLYVGDVESSVNRPIRELRRFSKVELEAGEQKTVTFVLDQRSFAYYDVQLHDWQVESGQFEIEIGSSSRDIRLTIAVEVENTEKVKMVFTRESTIGELMKSEKGHSVMAMMKKTASDGENKEVTAGSEDTKHLGEGSDKMIQKMMQDMPLSALMNFADITEEQLEGMLMMLNGE